MLTEHAVSSLGLETQMKENKCDMNNKCKCLIQQSWKYKYDEHYTAGWAEFQITIMIHDES
jgi:hypothetical protein